MDEIVVTNSNVVFDLIISEGETRQERRRRQAEALAADPSRRDVNNEWRRYIEFLRRLIGRKVCSSTWAEDCLYRGVDYAPDFRCQCPRCREDFPDRLYPRPARESSISIDCQEESEQDPEIAEDLARLRNDRMRVGSVFFAASARDRGGGSSRRTK